MDEDRRKCEVFTENVLEILIMKDYALGNMYHVNENLCHDSKRIQSKMPQL